MTLQSTQASGSTEQQDSKGKKGGKGKPKAASSGKVSARYFFMTYRCFFAIFFTPAGDGEEGNQVYPESHLRHGAAGEVLDPTLKEIQSVYCCLPTMQYLQHGVDPLPILNK